MVMNRNHKTARGGQSGPKMAAARALLLGLLLLLSMGCGQRDRKGTEPEGQTTVSAKGDGPIMTTPEKEILPPPDPPTRTRPPSPEERFQRLDKSGDGSLSKEEMLDMAKSPGDKFVADRAFAKKDKDADGRITKEEFMAAGAKKMKDDPGPPAMAKEEAKPEEVPAQPLVVAERPEPVSSRKVTLFFATLRKFTNSKLDPRWFNAEVSEEADPLTYGTCLVTIPPKHEKGNVEKKAGLWDFVLMRDPNDPERYVVVYEPKLMALPAFDSAITAGIQQRQRADKSLLVFVHGFNNTFDEAASRLAVLVYDMDYNGVPVLFSWPSVGGGVAGVPYYLREEEQAQHAYAPFAKFLESISTIARAAGAERVNVVAHSMGNRVLLDGLQRLSRAGRKHLVNEVIMAAPDVKAERFDQDVWPEVREVADRVTLYASNEDRALSASQSLRNMIRLGQVPGPPSHAFVAAGIDTIDASDVDFSAFGLNHSYFGGPTVIKDLLAVLELRLRAGDGSRPIREKTRIKDLPVWCFPRG
jgi:esterase/lipase superfamily enzyme